MEPEYCTFIIYHGSRNPDSANFGPDEYCEEEAAEDEEFCSQHLQHGTYYDGPDDW